MKGEIDPLQVQWEMGDLTLDSQTKKIEAIGFVVADRSSPEGGIAQGSFYGQSQYWVNKSAQAATLDAGAGNDLIGGSAASETITGSAGNDFVAGGGGKDTLLGGAGWDYIVADANAMSNGGFNATGEFRETPSLTSSTGGGTVSVHINSKNATETIAARAYSAWARGLKRSKNHKKIGCTARQSIQFQAKSASSPSGICANSYRKHSNLIYSYSSALTKRVFTGACA
jgi:RTX calcium-binding nonapeptide repeat (4 copies)